MSYLVGGITPSRVSALAMARLMAKRAMAGSFIAVKINVVQVSCGRSTSRLFLYTAILNF